MAFERSGTHTGRTLRGKELPRDDLDPKAVVRVSIQEGAERRAGSVKDCLCLECSVLPSSTSPSHPIPQLLARSCCLLYWNLCCLMDRAQCQRSLAFGQTEGEGWEGVPQHTQQVPCVSSVRGSFLRGPVCPNLTSLVQLLSYGQSLCPLCFHQQTIGFLHRC